MIGLLLAATGTRFIIAEASSPLTHTIMGSGDDVSERFGPHVTYALIEKVDGEYQVIRFSPNAMPIQNERQELLFISNNYTNLAPAWTGQMRFIEDPLTHARSDYEFVCTGAQQSAYKKESYSACNTDFHALAAGQPTMWKIGTTARFTLAPTSLDAVAAKLDLMAKAASDADRFLFKPEAFLSHGDAVAADREIKIPYMTGLFSSPEMPLASVSRFVISHQGECWPITFVPKTGGNATGRLCSEKSDPLMRAYKADKRPLNITEVVGQRKPLHGGTWGRWTFNMRADRLAEWQYLSEDEAKKFD